MNSSTQLSTSFYPVLGKGREVVTGRAVPGRVPRELQALVRLQLDAVHKLWIPPTSDGLENSPTSQDHHTLEDLVWRRLIRPLSIQDLVFPLREVPGLA